MHTLLLVIDKDIDTILKELNSYKKISNLNKRIFWTLESIKITLLFVIKTGIQFSVLTTLVKHHGNSKYHG